MDFISESFPDFKVHIALYSLHEESGESVSFPDKLAEQKKQLAELARTQ